MPYTLPLFGLPSSSRCFFLKSISLFPMYVAGKLKDHVKHVIVGRDVYRHDLVSPSSLISVLLIG